MDLELKVIFNGKNEKDLSINTKIDRLKQINRDNTFLIVINSLYSSPYRLGKIINLEEYGIKSYITLATMQDRFEKKYEVGLSDLVAVYELVIQN